MAKRRDLKKTIEDLSGGLMAEIELCSLRPEVDREKLQELINRVIDMNSEYRRRILQPADTATEQPAKRYYRKLDEDLDTEA
jgi:hypothetical protein